MNALERPSQPPARILAGAISLAIHTAGLFLFQAGVQAGIGQQDDPVTVRLAPHKQTPTAKPARPDASTSKFTEQKISAKDGKFALPAEPSQPQGFFEDPPLPARGAALDQAAYRTPKNVDVLAEIDARINLDELPLTGDEPGYWVMKLFINEHGRVDAIELMDGRGSDQNKEELKSILLGTTFKPARIGTLSVKSQKMVDIRFDPSFLKPTAIEAITSNPVVLDRP